MKWSKRSSSTALACRQPARASGLRCSPLALCAAQCSPPAVLVLASESPRRWQRASATESAGVLCGCVGCAQASRVGGQSGCVLWSLTVDALLDLLLLLDLLAQSDRAAVSWAAEACKQAPDKTAATEQLRAALVQSGPARPPLSLSDAELQHACWLLAQEWPVADWLGQCPDANEDPHRG